MIAHTLITVPIVLLGLFLHWALGWPAVLAATAMTALWFSREQYFEELKLREVGRRSIADVLLTFVLVFRPIRRNLDFFAPVAAAWLLTLGYVQLMPVWLNL